MTTPQPDIRTILVATDLSPASDVAVDQAARLAAQRGAQLLLLHVFNDGLWASVKAIYAAERWAGVEPAIVSRDRLSRQASAIAAQFGIGVRCETRTGSAATEIAAFGRGQGADLLVIGEHGEDRISDAVLGGTALKVLKRADLPVLLARRPFSPASSRILVATDFSDNAHRAAQLSVRLFPEAHQQLVHAYSVAFEGRMRLAGATDEEIERYRADEAARTRHLIEEQRAALGAAVALDTLVKRGTPAGLLIDEAARQRADLIVIGRHGGTIFDERLMGSVTQNVLYHAGCNVLLVP